MLVMQHSPVVYAGHVVTVKDLVTYPGNLSRVRRNVRVVHVFLVYHREAAHSLFPDFELHKTVDTFTNNAGRFRTIHALIKLNKSL